MLHLQSKKSKTSPIQALRKSRWKRLQNHLTSGPIKTSAFLFLVSLAAISFNCSSQAPRNWRIKGHRSERSRMEYPLTRCSGGNAKRLIRSVLHLNFPEGELMSKKPASKTGWSGISGKTVFAWCILGQMQTPRFDGIRGRGGFFCSSRTTGHF